MTDFIRNLAKLTRRDDLRQRESSSNIERVSSNSDLHSFWSSPARGIANRRPIPCPRVSGIRRLRRLFNRRLSTPGRRLDRLLLRIVRWLFSLSWNSAVLHQSSLLFSQRILNGLNNRLDGIFSAETALQGFFTADFLIRSYANIWKCFGL
jgi:hypothetical protein